MHDALIGLIERSELAVASAEGLVEPDTLEEAITAIGHARARLEYPEDLLVVALAGGTGSGKSSLFNALTGAEHAAVGAMRPTTAEPMAAMPAGRATVMSGLLDRLGVESRVESAGFGHCLIDLPDTDSVVVDHRHRVEQVIPRLDVLIWVLDPEKYRDRAIHHRYLRPLSGYAAQFVVVLNQVDRLGPGEEQEVLDDLAAALTEDGVAESALVACATPPGLSTRGIDELGEVIDALAGQAHLLYRKLLIDLQRSASAMAAELGASTGYRERVATVLDGAARLVASGDQPGAVAVLTEFYQALAAEVGGKAGDLMSSLANQVPNMVDRVARSITPTPRRRWWRRQDPHDRVGEARARLGEAAVQAEAALAQRGRAVAAVADMALGVGSALRGGL